MFTAKVEAQGQDVRAAITQGLLLAGRRWRTRLNERLKTIGQTDARCAALTEIAGAPEGMMQRELSQRLGVEEPTVVRLVDALEANDWVERQAHAADRRAKLLRIKPTATPILEEAQLVVADLQAELFADIEPAELAVCLKVLNELSRKLERA